MIVVKLWGGLGNQMFQYAAARALTLRNGEQLKMDVSWFERIAPGETPRRYELGVFDIRDDFASTAEVRRLRGPDIRRWPKLLKKAMKDTGLISPRTCIREEHFHFDPRLLDRRGSFYLDGYWQSEKYFADAADVIRREFTLKTPADGENRRILEQIGGEESVSVHFRLGDFVTNPNAAAYHPVAPFDYYRAAMHEVGRRVADARFYIFSDDLAWVKANFVCDWPVTFVEGNGPEKGGEDLRLMSACSHHIIANSSFSWWGAWLGENPAKIVIAPKVWFKNATVDTGDLIPERWTTL